VSEWVRGTSFDFGGGGPLFPLAASGGNNAANNGGGASASEDELDNLTRGALMPIFLVVNQVEGLSAVIRGLLDGIKSGLEDDYKFIEEVATLAAYAGGYAWGSAKAEIHLWKSDPKKRRDELFNAVKSFVETVVFQAKSAIKKALDGGSSTLSKYDWWSWDGWKQATCDAMAAVESGVNSGITALKKAWDTVSHAWAAIVKAIQESADSFSDRIMAEAELEAWKGFPWDSDPLLREMSETTRILCKGVGFTFGYAIEQVVIGVISSGTVTIAKALVKGGGKLVTTLAKRTAAAATTRLLWGKKFLQEFHQALIDAGMGEALLVAAYKRGMVLCAQEPIGPNIFKVIFEAIETAMERASFNRRTYNYKKFMDDLTKDGNIRKLIAREGGEAIVQRRLAQMCELLGDDCTADVMKNFMKVAEERLIIVHPNGQVDEFFEGFFRAFEGNPANLADLDGPMIDSLSSDAKARLKFFLSDPNAGKLFKMDDWGEYNAMIDKWEPDVPHRYWVRGLLGELDVFYRTYKPYGYTHLPTAPAVDLTGAMLVQVKTCKNPASAGSLGLTKKAMRALAAYPNPGGKVLRLHIVSQKGTETAAETLAGQLRTYAQQVFPDHVFDIHLSSMD
jgi:hypothetical protein